MLQDAMKLMALDIGDRRVGVAVSDTLGLIASPLEVVHRTSKVEDFARIAQLVRQHRVAVVVIGQPLRADGGLSPQAERIRRYALALFQWLRDDGLDPTLLFWDESFSTVQAQQAMIAGGRSARDRRGRVDAAAAAAILQDYLDDQRPGPANAVGEELL